MIRGSDRDRWPGRAEAVSLPHATASVREARRQVLLGLRRAGVEPALIDDAVLVASELVTNALRHARPLPDGRVRVAWEWAPGGETVRLSVRDGGSEASRPVVRAPVGADAMAGRGLGIVASVADRWGFDSEGDETVVWAVLASRAARARGWAAHESRPRQAGRGAAGSAGGGGDTRRGHRSDQSRGASDSVLVR
jgi:anti-sigma regulatory factor (Ser/Thr protein kinase)